MRLLPVVAALAVAGALGVCGCSDSSSGTGAAAASAPASSAAPSTAAQPIPSIPESFTLLPCPAHRPVTTLQIEGCAEHRIVALDSRVTQIARSVYAELRSAAAKRRLVASQAAWIARRRAVCLEASNAYSGGTLAPVAYATCEVRQDRRRAVALAALGGAASP
ncbi:MAG TPA: lysozyme inhibitor LprI family protein [Mycobacteriales bacterium]|nr:lysozyme inhibitor LprI family protein [Mycobacteriales bacterium]